MEVYPRMPREGRLEKVVEGHWRESSTEGLGQWVTTPVGHDPWGGHIIRPPAYQIFTLRFITSARIIVMK